MKQQKMRVAGTAQSLWLCLFVVLSVGKCCEGADLAAKCSLLVEKVIPCLNFATGQVSVPSKECCEATSKIKESEPECLCYVIQQTHKGSPEVKSMGIQEGRLLQLPSACNFKNASTSHCPKVLGLSPNSPDAAIFTNSSLKTAPVTAGTTKPVSENQSSSYGGMLRPSLIIAVVCAILFIMNIPVGSVSNIY